MNRPVALALLLAAFTTGAQAAPVVLPEAGPIPSARPSTAASVPAAVRLEPVAISTTPMPIPESRVDVRVVGSRFLPPLSQDIDFQEPAEHEIELLARSVEWFVATTANRLMDDATVEPPQQTAAVEGERISVVIGPRGN